MFRKRGSRISGFRENKMPGCPVLETRVSYLCSVPMRIYCSGRLHSFREYHRWRCRYVAAFGCSRRNFYGMIAAATTPGGLSGQMEIFLYGIFRYSEPYGDINTPDIVSRQYPESVTHCLATSYTKKSGFYPKTASRAPIFQLPAVRHWMSAFFTAALRFLGFSPADRYSVCIIARKSLFWHGKKQNPRKPYGRIGQKPKENCPDTHKPCLGA